MLQVLTVYALLTNSHNICFSDSMKNINMATQFIWSFEIYRLASWAQLIKALLA